MAVEEWTQVAMEWLCGRDGEEEKNLDERERRMVEGERDLFRAEGVAVERERESDGAFIWKMIFFFLNFGSE